MRKTKIVCTLGPSTDTDEVLEGMIQAGMNVARMNFSHGTHEDHKRRIEQVRRCSEKLQMPVALLLDTKGPEIRTRDFENGKVELVDGQTFTLITEEVLGDQNRSTISYKNLYQDVQVGSKVLINDGLIEMEVEKIEGTDIVCHVIHGGIVSNHKGINVPQTKLSMPYVSQQDLEDILFGVEQDVDFVAASFVRSAEDVAQIRSILKEHGAADIKIISKIENAEGVDNIDEIIAASDGIMVARGDMGVEIPGEDVPVIQKILIRKVYEAGKIVITATQMLESMIHNPRPTRAETADVANAIFDGTSAIMLSGETAAGEYPVEAVAMMNRIALRTEESINYKKRFDNYGRRTGADITTAISHATCMTAHDLNAKAILTVTKSGTTARMISRYRPDCDIIGCTMSTRVLRQLCMSWGVTPHLLQEESDVFELFDAAVKICKSENMLQTGDVVVMTSGVPIGKSGTTNMIKAEVVE